MENSMIDKMVGRFLRWKLPASFVPDAGIEFRPPSHPHSWPTGTNLLTSEQAREMVKYMLEGIEMNGATLREDALVLVTESGVTHDKILFKGSTVYVPNAEVRSDAPLYGAASLSTAGLEGKEEA